MSLGLIKIKEDIKEKSRGRYEKKIEPTCHFGAVHYKEMWTEKYFINTYMLEILCSNNLSG